jgi:hypothetical protein
MNIEQKPCPSNKSVMPSAIRTSKVQNSRRAGIAFFMVIFVTAVVVMTFTQTALRGVISERTSERQRQSTRQLEKAIECTSGVSKSERSKKITLPLDPESDERIEVIRDGDTVTARWMTGNQERDSLTRTEP